MSTLLPNEFDFRLKLQRYLTVFALLAIALVGWYFLVESHSAMRTMRGEGVFVDLMWLMMKPANTLPYLGATILMWVVMMLAMMVPAVLPMVVVFRKLDRPGREADTFLFACGYLLAWSVFSIVAAIVQWWLHDSDRLVGSLLSARPVLAGFILMTAGLYQLTPVKEACLANCRSPMGFFMANSRAGRVGALHMGLHHGAYCIGCCWVLMLIMFAGGAMSVMTMAALSAFILAERILPGGPWAAQLPGVALIAWGVSVIVMSSF